MNLKANRDIMRNHIYTHEIDFKIKPYNHRNDAWAWNQNIIQFTFIYDNSEQ